jgi:hypothetical protein
MLPLCEQRIAGTFDIHAAKTGAGHRISFEYRTVVRNMYIRTTGGNQAVH